MNETDLLRILLFAGLGFLVVLLVMRTITRSREQRLEQVWSELASLSGLSFNPGDRTFWKKNSQQPQVTGIFRGRKLSLTKVIESYPYPRINEHTGLNELIYVPVEFTEITISVNNTGCVSLSIEQGGFLRKIFRKNIIASGDEDFDERFIVKGPPSLFVRRALALIVSQKSLFLNCLQGATNDLLDSDTTLKRPSIELKGPELVCHQHGILTDNQKQIAFLNLLCDLAELAERTGSSA